MRGEMGKRRRWGEGRGERESTQVDSFKGLIKGVTNIMLTVLSELMTRVSEYRTVEREHSGYCGRGVNCTRSLAKVAGGDEETRIAE